MTVVCINFGARKFKDEAALVGMSCHGGKVIIDVFLMCLPPPFLMQLLDGTDDRSVHLIKNIRPNNNLFQMTNFDHKDESVMGWNPSLRVQGQVFNGLW